MDTPTRARLADTVAANVRSSLILSGVSVKALAERTGIPRTTLLRRLDGHQPFTVAEVEAIAEVVGVLPESLMRGAA